MNIKNKKAFSMSELMIVMLITTVVLAAASPIITRLVKEPDSSKSSNLPVTNIKKGMIVAYYGTSLPANSGWAICDGNNNTPDLRGYFIRGLDTRAYGSESPVDYYSQESTPDATETGQNCYQVDNGYYDGDGYWVPNWQEQCDPIYSYTYHARPLASVQVSSNKIHYHGLYSTDGVDDDQDYYHPAGLADSSNIGIPGSAYSTWLSPWYYYKTGYNSVQLLTTGKYSSSYTTSPPDTDAAEAVPKNIVLMYIMKI